MLSSWTDPTLRSFSSTSTYVPPSRRSKQERGLTLGSQVAEMIRPIVEKYERPFPALLEIPSKDHPYGSCTRSRRDAVLSQDQIRPRTRCSSGSRSFLASKIKEITAVFDRCASDTSLVLARVLLGRRRCSGTVMDFQLIFIRSAVRNGQRRRYDGVHAQNYARGRLKEALARKLNRGGRSRQPVVRRSGRGSDDPTAKAVAVARAGGEESAGVFRGRGRFSPPTAIMFALRRAPRLRLRPVLVHQRCLSIHEHQSMKLLNDVRLTPNLPPLTVPVRHRHPQVGPCPLGRGGLRRCESVRYAPPLAPSTTTDRLRHLVPRHQGSGPRRWTRKRPL